VTANNFFLPAGYQINAHAQCSRDLHSQSSGDPYALAVTLARQYECQYVIAIGCGDAEQLLALQSELIIIGLESGEKLAQCRQTYPQLLWIDITPDAPISVDLPEVILNDALILSVNLIEQLADPSHVLALLHQLLQQSKVAILTTPQRPADDLGPPSKANQVRLWSADELQHLLASLSMRAAHCGPTTSQQSIVAVVPGQSLHAAAIRDLGTFSALWLQASAEQRAASAQLEQHHLDLAKLQAEVAQLEASGTATAAPVSLLDSAIADINSARYEEAFATLNKALAQEPENADIIFQMGRLAAICDMHNDAQLLFYQAALRNPELVKDIVSFFQRQVQNARNGTL
jgi:hypothetical protein